MFGNMILFILDMFLLTFQAISQTLHGSGLRYKFQWKAIKQHHLRQKYDTIQYSIINSSRQSQEKFHPTFTERGYPYIYIFSIIYTQYYGNYSMYSCSYGEQTQVKRASHHNMSLHTKSHTTLGLTRDSFSGVSVHFIQGCTKL